MAINEIEHCEHTEVHAETVRAVREHMPAEDELYDLAELFKVFGLDEDPYTICTL